MSLDRYRRPKMIVLHSTSTAYEAARAMAEHRVGSVLIGEGQEIVGIVTDRDLVLHVVARDLDPYATRLSEIMSTDVVTLDVSAALADVTHQMRLRACRRIPITEDGKPVGLVTLDDLLVDGEFSQGTRLAVAAQLDAEAPQEPRTASDHRRIAVDPVVASTAARASLRGGSEARRPGHREREREPGDSEDRSLVRPRRVARPEHTAVRPFARS